MIKALVEAMAYEPAVICDSGKMLYSVEPPMSAVDYYIGDFTNDNNLVCHECSLCECPGPTPLHSHTFLIDEGTCECVNCAKQYCLMCVSSDDKDSSRCICIPCRTEGQANLNDVILGLSTVTMWEALQSKIEVPATASISN